MNTMTCISCGNVSESYLCKQCLCQTNIEELCNQVIVYNVHDGSNELWNQILLDASDIYNLKKDIVYTLSEYLASPRREYIRILYLTGNKQSEYVPKDAREWLYETFKHIKNSQELSQEELNYIFTLVLSALVNDYCYYEAENIAEKLKKVDKLPKQAYCVLGDYYTKTRRYEVAESILLAGARSYQTASSDRQRFDELLEDNEKRRRTAENGTAKDGKREYMPASNEAKKKYVEFMHTLGIDLPLPEKAVPKPIPKDKYPAPIETKEDDFISFVAFDVETTGIDSNVESIIEIGAIKVIDGQIVEEKEFIFQEFVRPYKSSVSLTITELTGITTDDVKDARQMWEVIPDFLDFVGDLNLVGYNSISFDSRFLARAGRYSKRIISNKHFDVKHYVKDVFKSTGREIQDFKLNTVAQYLGIKNTRAHRALADAITTAKIFLRLKEIKECKYK